MLKVDNQTPLFVITQCYNDGRGVHPFCLLKGHINKWQTRSTLSVKPILNMNITVMLTIRQLHLKNHNLVLISSMQNRRFKKLRLTWENTYGQFLQYFYHPPIWSHSRSNTLHIIIAWLINVEICWSCTHHQSEPITPHAYLSEQTFLFWSKSDFHR